MCWDVQMSCFKADHWLMYGYEHRALSFTRPNIITRACTSLDFLSPSALSLSLSEISVVSPPLLSSSSLTVNSLQLVSSFIFFSTPNASNYAALRFISPSPLLLWLAPVVFKQSDRPLWPMILSGPDSLLSPWWRMAEALPCLVLNYCWG